MGGVVVLPAPVPVIVVEASAAEAFVIVAGAQGVPGPAGPAGQAVSTTPVIAAATISAYTGVALANGDAIQADSTQAAQRGNVLGVATNGANAGGGVNVQYAGPLEYNGWNWTLGEPVFLGAAGVLTQAVPTSGFSQILGIPLNPTTLLIQMQPAIGLV